MDLVSQNGLHGAVLALENARRTGKSQVRRIDAGGFYDAAVLRNIAVEDRQAAIDAEGVGDIANHPARAVQIEAGVARALAECHGGAHSAGRGAIKLIGRGRDSAHHIQLVDGLAQAGRMNRVRLAMEQPATLQFTQDGEDATRPVHVFQMHCGRRWRHLAQVRNAARKPVDIRHGERHFGLLRRGQQVQNGIRRPAHGNVQRHRVFKGLEGGNAARKHRCVVVLVVAPGQLDDGPSRLKKKLLAVGVRGQHAAIAGQSQPQRLGQAVH